nr:hypothetical protein [candidate division Zixibacteria bacterium]
SVITLVMSIPHHCFGRSGFGLERVGTRVKSAQFAETGRSHDLLVKIVWVFASPYLINSFFFVCPVNP